MKPLPAEVRELNQPDHPSARVVRLLSFDRLARAGFRAAMTAKNLLRRVPAFRRIYYSFINANSFDQLFWHDFMLADTVRMRNYAAAIEKHVHPGMVVADLGTGSGVLACLAAMRGAKVYAIEHGPIIERARQLAAANGLTNIQFVHSHSREFHPVEKVDLLLHEQIGMSLLDEDMVENLLDLRARVLKPGGKILPGHFSLFVDPVELVSDRRLPYLWEQRIGGLDFSCFRPPVPPGETPNGYDKRALDPADVQQSLARHQCLLHLDLHTVPTSDLPQVLQARYQIETPGRLDGFCLYFEIRFDDVIGFKTGPESPRTHWGSRLLRCEARPLEAGEKIDFTFRPALVTNADSWQWSYQVLC
jgi:type I protein arginine methyltransferase